MGIGSLFNSNSVARQTLYKPPTIKKKGIHVDWPAVPPQQVKDYRVITTAEDLIAYLKRCEETGLCGFDYETTVNDKYRQLWEEKSEEYRADIDLCEFNLMEANSEGDKKAVKIAQAALLSATDAYNSRLTEDFFKAPLDPWKSEICTVSLSAAPHEARIIFINNVGRNQYRPNNGITTNEQKRRAIFQILNDLLFRNKRITKIAVNLSFEAKQTAALGMYIMEPVADPFIMWVRCLQVAAPERICNPKAPAKGKGLKDMTLETFGVQMSHFEDLLEKHGVQFFSEISADDPEALVYSAEDSDYAVQHYLYWREVAKQIPKYDEWLHKIEMPFTRVIGLMEYWGLAWDDTIAEQKAQEAIKLRDQTLAEIIQMGADFGIKITPGKTGKTASVQELLFNKLGVPVPKISEKTEKPSLDAESLIDMKFMVERKLYSLKEEPMLADGRAAKIEKRPDLPHKAEALKLIELIGKVQKYTTLLSSHIEGRRKYLNPISGRIHANYTQWTETGRLNSSSPNAQNTPRADRDEFGIRNFYYAPEGKILLLIDFSGFELRLMAWKSGDEVMTNIFAHGDGDLHRKTAATITGKDPRDITKAERYRAKAPNFLISYGGTEHALRLNLKKDYGIRETLDECAKLINAVKTTYPRIPEYQNKIALEAREQGYVQTIYGYIRMLPNIGSFDRSLKRGDERRAANTPIQGSAADIMKRCQNECYELIGSNEEYRKRVRLDAQIHDEQIFELDDDPEFVVRFAADVKAIMEKPPLPAFPLPIVAEADVGYRWGSKISLEEWLKKGGGQHD